MGLGTGAVGTAPGRHAVGSQDASWELAGVGAAMAPDRAAGEAAVAGDVLDEVSAVVPVELAVGALTVNWVPVTTVTCAPSATLVGS